MNTLAGSKASPLRLFLACCLGLDYATAMVLLAHLFVPASFVSAQNLNIYFYTLYVLALLSVASVSLSSVAFYSLIEKKILTTTAYEAACTTRAILSLVSIPVTTIVFLLCSDYTLLLGLSLANNSFQLMQIFRLNSERRTLEDGGSAETFNDQKTNYIPIV